MVRPRQALFWLCLALLGLAVACKGKSKEGPAPHRPLPCIVHLHGKGGAGAPPQVAGAVVHVRPTGNAAGWGGKQWLYFPESDYAAVKTTVASAIADNACTRTVIHGFSNGGAAAAKLYCRGEDFGGKVAGYIVDDPVPDHGVDGCKPKPNVKIRLYSTKTLAQATDGWSCTTPDWTCEGGSTIGIERYARALGTSVARSSQSTHAEYPNPAEYAAWLE